MHKKQDTALIIFTDTFESATVAKSETSFSGSRATACKNWRCIIVNNCASARKSLLLANFKQARVLFACNYLSRDLDFRNESSLTMRMSSNPEVMDVFEFTDHYIQDLKKDTLIAKVGR